MTKKYDGEFRQTELLTVRFDSEVLDWFIGQGGDYKAKINEVLRSYYEAHKNKGS